MSVTHIRPEGEKGWDPALLAISAFVNEGWYNPEAYGIPDQAFSSQSTLHAFCKKYAASAGGEAPSAAVVEARYGVKVLPEFNVQFAVDELLTHHNDQIARRNVGRQIEALHKGELHKMLEISSGLGKELVAKSSESIFWEPGHGFNEDIAPEFVVPVPQHTAGRVRGIGAGELWVIAARLGEGKTWRLIEHSLSAIAAGYDVMFYSLEMPVGQIVGRAMHLDPDLASRPGRLRVVDQFRLGKDLAPIDLKVHLHNVERPTIAVVDYFGIMVSNERKRPSTDWNTADAMGKDLQAIAVQTGMPVLLASQFNRSAAHYGAPSFDEAMPDAAQLALTDALGQGATGIVALRKDKRLSYTTNYLIKYRHGTSGHTWYTDFDPMGRRMDELPTDVAYERWANATDLPSPAVRKDEG